MGNEAIFSEEEKKGGKNPGNVEDRHLASPPKGDSWRIDQCETSAIDKSTA